MRDLDEELAGQLEQREERYHQNAHAPSRLKQLGELQHPALAQRAQVYLDDPTLVRNITADGCEKARRLASETMRDVREAMGLIYV